MKDQPAFSFCYKGCLKNKSHQRGKEIQERCTAIATKAHISSDCMCGNACACSTCSCSSYEGNRNFTRRSRMKTYELLLVQHPHLTPHFISDAVAAAEAAGGQIKGEQTKCGVCKQHACRRHQRNTQKKAHKLQGCCTRRSSAQLLKHKCFSSPPTRRSFGLLAEAQRVSRAGTFIGLRGFVSLSGNTCVTTLRSSLAKAAADNGGDFLLRRRSIAGLCLQLVCFDMDSTLIEEEVIDEIAAEVGKKEEVAALTRWAMEGGASFAQSFKLRLSVLKGLDRAALSAVGRRLNVTRGGLDLCRLLKARGVFLCILSGGFTLFAEEFKQKLQIDFVAANQLGFTQEGQLTGEAVDPIVTPEEKKRLLLELSEKQQQRWQHHLAVSASSAGPLAAAAVKIVTDSAARAQGGNAAAIGDGSNDILMLRAAATGIAFCAKEKVKAEVPLHLNSRNLFLAAYFLGIQYPDGKAPVTPEISMVSDR
ncbi:hypothetical protein Efla_001890 [Eimeria flavescens]